MQQRLLHFVSDLRARGLPVSIAESLDAVRAVGLVGVERPALREVLAACLMKDEADRPLFDATFETHFPLIGPGGSGKRAHSRAGSAGDAGGSPVGRAKDSGSPVGRAKDSGAPAGRAKDSGPPAGQVRDDGAPARRGAAGAAVERRVASSDSNRNFSAGRVREHHAREAQSEARAEREAPAGLSGTATKPIGRERRSAGLSRAARELVLRPFRELGPVEVDELRDVAAVLARRLRGRLARRLRRTRRGRVDVRRTLRQATSTGGVPVRLAIRGRRPGRPDLVALCDVSGSVALASELLLGLIAPAREFFRSVETYVYVDHLHAASFEHGYLVHAPGLDRHAFSDFGQVLSEYWGGRGHSLGRNTLVVVLGDARNNRRPANARILAEMRARARAVLWLNPEPASRWNTGDSVIGQYAPHCDAVFECVHLEALVDALGHAL